MTEQVAVGIIVVDLDRCLACRSCEFACVKAHAGGGDIVEVLASDNVPGRRVRVIQSGGRAVPVQCQHCADAACTAVCPAGALVREKEGGPLRLIVEKCVGCGACVNACPLGAVWLYERGGVAVKCDLCEGIIGFDEDPACVAACPTRARRVVGAGDAATEEEALLRDRYAEFVRQNRPKAPERYTIDLDKCICCGRCAKQCPVDCISGKPGRAPASATDKDREAGRVGEPFEIDQKACIRCGSCFAVCPADAVAAE